MPRTVWSWNVSGRGSLRKDLRHEENSRGSCKAHFAHDSDVGLLIWFSSWATQCQNCYRSSILVSFLLLQQNILTEKQGTEGLFV